MSKIRAFIIGSLEEVSSKVTWPLYSELQRSSLLVLIASLALSVVIGLMDLSLKRAVTWIYSCSAL